MNLKKAKLFWKLGCLEKCIHCLPYDDNQDFYSFLRNQYQAGYRQIIITSDIMIHLLTMLFLSNYTLTDIQFAEEDPDLELDVKLLISNANKDHTLFVDLIERLNFVAENSSIDIQKISFIGRDQNSVAVNGYVQSNGILAINNSAFESISQKICTQVKRCLF